MRWQKLVVRCKPRSDHPLLVLADDRSATSLRQPVSNSTSRTPPASMAHDEPLARARHSNIHILIPLDLFLPVSLFQGLCIYRLGMILSV